jgi:hypothetical protein
MSDSAASVVRRQFDTYNAHEIDAYMACFAHTIEMRTFPDDALLLKGHDQVRAFYTTKRFNIPSLRAELLGQLVFGDFVIYHEKLIGLDPGTAPVAIAIHEVKNGLIQRMWFIRG